jgi:hypothetical protein
MKKPLIVLLLTITVCSKNSKAQNAETPDTLAYLQTIVANKNFYIGKPFSVLIDSLKIEIKFFSPFASIHYAITKETSTSFSFYLPQSADDHYLSYPRLEVYWLPYLNAKQSSTLFDTYDGRWAPDVISHYGTGIISDIKILE